MDFTISEEQAGLVDSVAEVLARECPADVVRAVAEGDAAAAAPLWDRAVQLGWPAIAVPAELGGLGRGAVETALIVEQLGAAAAPGPFLATMTQFVPAILEAGDDAQRRRWVTAVAEQGLAGTLAVAESGAWQPTAVRATAEPDGDGWRLTGTKTHVVDPTNADELVVAARAEGTPALFVVPVGEVTVTPTESLDPSRPIADVVLDGVHVPAGRRLQGGGAQTVRRILETATVGLAAELVGVCQAILEMTVDYAGVREQFGRPIGSFQAVKHQLADGYVAIERARATLYFAAMTLAEDDDRRAVAVASAKAAAGDAEAVLSRAGIQLHGGIGYTWEHDLHLYVKRAMGAAALFGNSAAQRQRIADLLGI